LQGFEYIQKIQKLIRVSLGRNRARPSCTARARPTATRVYPSSASASAARHGCLMAAPSPAHGRWLGKRGGAHRSMDDGAARRRRRRRRVAWQLGDDQRRAAWRCRRRHRRLGRDGVGFGPGERVASDSGSRDAARLGWRTEVGTRREG
jgi:hypothetical protein